MKTIFFFVHRFNDIDHLAPIIFFTSRAKKNVRFIIISLFPSKGHGSDYRIKKLLNEENVYFYNYTQLLQENFKHRLLNFILGIGTTTGSIRKDFFLLLKHKNRNTQFYQLISNIISNILKKINLLNFITLKYLNSEWSSELFKKFNPSLIVTDHAISSGPQRDLEPIRSIFQLSKKNKIKILSLPHGVPLFIKHPKRYDNVKKNLINDISDYLIFQHKNWLHECLDFGLNRKNIEILGLPRFYKKWEQILHSIVPDDSILTTFKTDKLKVVFMDTGPNNYGVRKNLVIDSLKFLSDNKHIFLIYKPHTRNNKINLPFNKNIIYGNNINSINLIKWADIIIGSSSSIMIECLYQRKIYLSPSYFRENKMIFEEYDACLELRSYKEFRDFINNFNKKSLNPYNYYGEKNVEKFYHDIIYNKKDEDIILQNMIDYIISLTDKQITLP